MRFSLRFIGPLAIALAAIAYAVVPLVDRLTLQWFVRDLEIRGNLLANTMHDPLLTLIEDGSEPKLRAYLERISQDERVFAIAVCDATGALRIATRNYPEGYACRWRDVESKGDPVVQLPRGLLHVATFAIGSEQGPVGELVIAHDMSFVQRRSSDTRKYIFYLFAAIAAVVALITVVIAEISWRGWVNGIKALISGERIVRSPDSTPPPRELRPIAKDLRALVRDLESERLSRDESQMSWGPETLRRILHEDLHGDEILIVSNREPYIHVRAGGVVQTQRPASGLVTALEPVLRACSGTWIAHGSGSADREFVDGADRVGAPPQNPSYWIRRVWMSKEEEDGYYYGFSNEGLWPLCHIAHTRPVFRASDWAHYNAINQRFADAVVAEARTPNPIVMVQDYHLALVPRMVRERMPQATIIAFWHIPWPNPETFGILPWREALLDGLLGSSIIGFHTQFHCNNFMDTVDRVLEARVDRETFSITHGGHNTEVHRYPISIEWPPAALAEVAPVEACRASIRAELGVEPGVRLGLGIDRLDYTKGILERFYAVERLLEMQPAWTGRFSFVQIAAPSRSNIDEYRDFDARVRAAAARINRRFGRDGYQPIVLKIEHHDAARVYAFYRAADVCFVSSLHDGMNLVAKEFVAARDDERGVLVLSQFAGASRELMEALIVNPYDIEQCAAALHIALTMPETEQRTRMRGMRGLVQEFNVYRWAGRMLLDAGRMRTRQRVLAGHPGRD